MEEVEIKKIVPGGQGIGTLRDGKKIFLWNSLPGEVVTRYKITREKRSWAEGVAVEIEPSSISKYRVSPKDDCYLSTSPWQIMSYEYELAQKIDLWKESLRQEKIQWDKFKSGDRNNSQSLREKSRGGFDGGLKIITDGKEWEYRNKMEYSLYWSHESKRIWLSFHKRGSHQKIPVLNSSLEKREIFKKAQKIVEKMNFDGLEARNYQSLILRSNSLREVQGGLLEKGRPHPKFSTLKDKILGKEYSYSPNGFFQINIPVYEMALRQIKEWVQTGEGSVLDLYAGVGTIGLSVSEGKDLILVESNKAAFDELENNIKNNDAPAKGILAKSEEVLDFIRSEQTVIVDPPRAGCDVKLIEKLLEVLPREIIYLSCNPVTQARDLAALLKSYSLVDAVAYNFFPKTPHVETLVRLKKN